MIARKAVFIAGKYASCPAASASAGCHETRDARSRLVMFDYACITDLASYFGKDA